MELSEMVTLLIFNATLIIPLFVWNIFELRKIGTILKSSLNDTQSVVKDIEQEVRALHNNLCPLEKRHWRK